MSDRRECPECGVSVKLENLPAHYEKQHPRATLDAKFTKEAEKVARARRAPPAIGITRRGIGVIAVVAVILAVILLIIIANPFRVGTNVGQVGPDFSLSTSTGGTVTLSSFRGTPVLLEFMDVDCGFCQSEARDVLSALYTSYSARVRFLSVDVNFVGQEDTNTRINEFRTTYDTPWPYSLDAGRDVQTRYGVRETPTTFILDRNGVITNILRGSQSGGSSTYTAALDAALRI